MQVVGQRAMNAGQKALARLFHHSQTQGTETGPPQPALHPGKTRQQSGMSLLCPSMCSQIYTFTEVREGDAIDLVLLFSLSILSREFTHEA